MTINQMHFYDVSTVANFKDWAQSIGLALAAFGWVQTTDTGQVNWATISTVPPLNNYVYEIWRPGDALTPFYVRINYGTSTNTANGSGPGSSLQIQSGTGTDGAGNLTGFKSNLRSSTHLVLNQGASQYNCLYSGDVSSFQIALWRSSGNGFLFAIERSRNATGAATSAYWTQYQMFADLSSSAIQGSQQSVVFGVGAAQEGGSSNQGFDLPFYSIVGPSIHDAALQSMLFNGTVGISPVFPYVGYFDYSALSFVVISSTDFSDNVGSLTLNIFPVTLAGHAHTYVVLQRGFPIYPGLSLGMRWE